jgi:general secretion pathway protein G
MNTTLRRGMTLVEVLAVVVLLGLIAATLSLGFSGAFGKGKRELARTGIGIVIGKVESYKIHTGQWPEPSLGLSVLTDGYALPNDSYYLSAQQLRDPWDTPYQFILPGPDGHPYEILSLGSDAQPGGLGEAADISSLNLRSSGQTQ